MLHGLILPHTSHSHRTKLSLNHNLSLNKPHLSTVNYNNNNTYTSTNQTTYANPSKWNTNLIKSSSPNQFKHKKQVISSLSDCSTNLAKETYKLKDFNRKQNDIQDQSLKIQFDHSPASTNANEITNLKEETKDLRARIKYFDGETKYFEIEKCVWSQDILLLQSEVRKKAKIVEESTKTKTSVKNKLLGIKQQIADIKILIEKIQKDNEFRRDVQLLFNKK